MLKEMKHDFAHQQWTIRKEILYWREAILKISTNISEKSLSIGQFESRFAALCSHTRLLAEQTKSAIFQDRIIDAHRWAKELAETHLACKSLEAEASHKMSLILQYKNLQKKAVSHLVILEQFLFSLQLLKQSDVKAENETASPEAVLGENLDIIRCNLEQSSVEINEINSVFTIENQPETEQNWSVSKVNELAEQLLTRVRQGLSADYPETQEIKI